MDTPEANKDLVRRWIMEVFNDNSPTAADEVVAADFIENALAPFGQDAPGLVDGPDHARRTVAALRAQFPDVRMEIDALAGDADLVAALVTAHGTNLGPINGMIPPTGRSFRVRQTHWFRVADGRLAEHWAVRDDLATMLQLGVIARPGPPAGANRPGG